MFRSVGNSPAAPASMWGSFEALGCGTLPLQLVEQITVAIADQNACTYCLAARTALGRKTGESADPLTAAALRFEGRGQILEADVASLREAEFDDEQIVEIMAHIALNLFTNYVNVALTYSAPTETGEVEVRDDEESQRRAAFGTSALSAGATSLLASAATALALAQVARSSSISWQAVLTVSLSKKKTRAREPAHLRSGLLPRGAPRSRRCGFETGMRNARRQDLTVMLIDEGSVAQGGIRGGAGGLTGN